MTLIRSLFFGWVGIFVSCAAGDVAAESRSSLAKSDAVALNHLFGESSLATAAETIWFRCQGLPENQQFDVLFQWVFPPNLSTPPRIGIFYTAYDREYPGGQCLSVAHTLVQKAVQTNQTNRIIEELERRSVEPAFSSRAIDVLLALQTDAVAQSVKTDLFFEAMAPSPDPTAKPPDALLVVLEACVSTEQSETVSIAVEVASRWLKLLERSPQLPAWHRHLAAIAGKLKLRTLESDANLKPAEEALTYWRPASRSRAYDRGLGFPQASWSVADQVVNNHISHDEEFLFFTIPLLGDYEVEGELGSFDYRDTYLMTNSRYIGLIYDHKHYREGIPRGVIRQTAFEPKLTNTQGHSFLRYRTWVKNDLVKTSVNGRIIRSEIQESSPAPWIGLNSSPRHHSIASDLRVTGTQGQYTIPEAVNMCDALRLPEWIEYHVLPERSELVHWRQRDRGEGNGTSEIIGLSSKGRPYGSFDESLLTYSRPMFEDGTIRYEFFYQPGKACVHPALGELAFLLAPDGIRVHQVTHGRYERPLNHLRPDNQTLVRENQRGPKDQVSPAKLPLMPGQWNQMKLAVEDNILTLALNGETVYEQLLSEDHRRVFGLFHFRDQTEARVREMAWTGQWPKELPTLEQQKLAVIPPALSPEGSQELVQQIHIDLRNEDLLSEQSIRAVSGYDGNQFTPTQEGLVIKRPAKKGYQTSTATANVRVTGDFDITVSFEDLMSESSPGKTATLLLEIDADSPTQDRASLQLKIDRKQERAIQCLDMQIIQGTERRHYFGHQPQDASAGSLRLSRRGNQIHYLIAENDSQQFSLIGQAEYTTDDLLAGEIQFGCQIQGEAGYTQARFVSVDIRAEKLSGLAISDTKEILANLNQRRSKLKDSVDIDFDQTSPGRESLYQWGRQTAWQPGQGGMQLETIGTSEWESSGISIRDPALGDFDVSIEIDQVDLAIPMPGKHSQVLLQLEFDDAAVRRPGIIKSENTQCSTLLTRFPSGAYAAGAQVRLPLPDGGYDYKTLAAVPVQTATSLRIACHEGNLLFVATVSEPNASDGEPHSNEILIAEYPIGNAPMDTYGIKALIHAGGQGKRATLRLKSIKVHGDSFALTGRGADPFAPPRVIPARVPVNQRPATPPKPKSFLRSIFDLF